MKEVLGDYRKAIRINAQNMVLSDDVTAGKMLRGCLTCLVCDSLEGNRAKATADLACAVEIIQHTSLIADGWIDGDLVRRGIPSFHLTHGESETLLNIIYLLSIPYSIVGRYGYEFIKEGAEAHQKMSMGVLEELKNLSTKKGLPATRVYKSILEKKTGVLFSLAAVYGAMSAYSDRIEEFRKYGTQLGIAYQIADDISDLESVLKGEKGIGTELLLLKCVHIDSLVDELISDLKAGTVDVKKVKKLLKTDEIRTKLMNMLRKEIDTCKNSLDELNLKEPYKEYLLKYPDYCVNLILGE